MSDCEGGPRFVFVAKGEEREIGRGVREEEEWCHQRTRERSSANKHRARWSHAFSCTTPPGKGKLALAWVHPVTRPDQWGWTLQRYVPRDGGLSLANLHALNICTTHPPHTHQSGTYFQGRRASIPDDHFPNPPIEVTARAAQYCALGFVS
jgi:hypothetical protein